VSRSRATVSTCSDSIPSRFASFTRLRVTDPRSGGSIELTSRNHRRGRFRSGNGNLTAGSAEVFHNKETELTPLSLFAFVQILFALFTSLCGLAALGHSWIKIHAVRILGPLQMNPDSQNLMSEKWSAATCRRFPRRDVSRRNKARTCPRTPKNLRVGIRFMESVLS
jgi:hypothetical protein